MLRELKGRLGSPAKDLIAGYLDEDCNYDLAWKTLNAIYFDPTRHIKKLVRDLLDMPEMMNDSVTMQAAYAKMKTVDQQFKGQSLTPEDISFIFFATMCESKLNTYCKKAWISTTQKMADDTHPIGSKVKLEDFFTCLE